MAQTLDFTFGCELFTFGCERFRGMLGPVILIDLGHCNQRAKQLQYFKS